MKIMMKQFNKSVLKKTVRKITLFTLFFSCLLTSGCVFVAGAAAGAAAVAIVYDHRKLENMLQDQQISQKIHDEMSDIPSFYENAHINITTFNHIVLLTGQANSKLLREQIEEVAREAEGVKKVYNQVTVGAAASSIMRTNDTWITTKIRTEMLATRHLASSSIKVVTEKRSVYLMGIVTREQANMAVDIARRVNGVQRVVKIFQYK